MGCGVFTCNNRTPISCSVRSIDDIGLYIMKKEQYEQMREYAHCVVKMSSVHSGEFNNLDTVEYATFTVMHLMYRMNLTNEQFAIFEQGFAETQDFLSKRLAHYNSTQIDLINKITK